MRICNTCKKEYDDIDFFKREGHFFKVCLTCRTKVREYNKNRKDPDWKEKKKLAAQRRYYNNIEENRVKTREYAKKWRSDNKEWLSQYEKSEERKEKNRKWKYNQKEKYPHRFIWYAARRRAKQQNIPFDICVQDITDVYPKDNICPILGIELKTNKEKSRDNSPSLDRIIPEKGYVIGNILIISYRANRIKNDATIDEIEKIFKFLKRVEL